MRNKNFVLDTNIWISAIITNSEKSLLTKRYEEAPDEDDNYLYDLCIETKSKLVTGDKLLLRHISNPPITTMTRFDFLSLF